MGIISTDEQIILGVIIPVYNGEKFLKESVCSVLNQPFENLKVIIVNDGSKDNSFKIATELSNQDERVHVINQTNSGVSVARNAGIEYCIKQNIKYMAFLDADDVWVNEFYTTELVEQMQNVNADAFRFSYYEANEQLTRGRLVSVENVVYEVDIPSFGGSFCSYIYKTDMFKKCHLRFPVGIKAQEDVSMLYVYLTNSRTVIYKKDPIFIYRSNPNSAVHKQKDVAEAYFNSIIPAWDWVKEELQKTSDKGQYLERISECDTMKKTFLSEFIQVACSNGMKLKQIKTKIHESKLSVLYDDASIWVDDVSLKRWESFKNSPIKTWIKYRSKGIYVNICRALIRNNKIVILKRYPCDLSQVYHANKFD